MSSRLLFKHRECRAIPPRTAPSGRGRPMKVGLSAPAFAKGPGAASFRALLHSGARRGCGSDPAPPRPAHSYKSELPSFLIRRDLHDVGRTPTGSDRQAGRRDDIGLRPRGGAWEPTSAPARSDPRHASVPKPVCRREGVRSALMPRSICASGRAATSRRT